MIGLWTVLLYIFGAGIALVFIATIVHQLRLHRHRGVSREDFVKEFRKLEIPDTIPAAVCDYYKSLAVSKRFTISPDDTYSDLFSDELEDIDDDAEHLVQKLGMQLPAESVLREWEKPLKTLRDMVLWLNWIHQHQHQA